jgi:E3 ubiquitin-protein ligase HUWE1
MYDDEYGEEMDYGDEIEDREENVSDEDEDIDGMGPVEGLPGDAGMVEVIMGEPDDDDEGDTDEDDEDDDEESEDSDDSDDIDGSGEQLDIVEEVEALQQAIDDGGGSPWESGTDDDGEDDDDDEADYEAEGQDNIDAQHALQDLEDRFGQIVRAAIDSNDVEVGREFREFADRILDGPPDAEIDEGDDDDDGDDDQDQDIYDEIYRRDDGQHAVPPPALGWDTLVVDQIPVIDHRHHHHGHHHHHHHGHRHTFRPSPFPVIGGHRDPLTGT